MPPKKKVDNVKEIKKTSSPQFDTLPEPKAKPTTAHLVKPEEMSKYGTMFKVFSETRHKSIQDKYGFSAQRGKKDDISWVGTYHKQLKQYYVDTYPKESTLSTWFGWLANVLLIIHKYK